MDNIPREMLGDAGLVALPIIVAQLFQTIFDYLIATKWLDGGRSADCGPLASSNDPTIIENSTLTPNQKKLNEAPERMDFIQQ